MNPFDQCASKITNKKMKEDSLSNEETSYIDSDLECVRNLMKFEHGISGLTRSYFISSYIKQVRESFSLVWALIGGNLMTSFGFLFLSQKGTPVEQASFGLLDSYFSVFFIALLMAVSDKIGISLSVCFGNKDFERLKVEFTQGIICLLITMLGISAPALYFSGSLLETIGILAVNASICQGALRLMIFVMVVQTTSEALRTFCMCQGHEHYFGYAAIFSTIASLGSSYLFMMVFEMGINGWILGKLVYEGINLSVAVWVFFNKTHPSTRGIVGFSKASKNLGKYSASMVKMVFGTYSDFLGFDIATYFVARSKNQELIAAYTACCSMSGIFYRVGAALSIITRTRLNIFMGMGLMKTAKNYYRFASYAALFTGLWLALLFSIFSTPISYFYAGSSEAMRDWFVLFALIYVCFMPFEVAALSSFAGIKATNQLGFFFSMNVIFPISLNIALQTLLEYLGGFPEGAFILYLFTGTMVNLCCYLKTESVDWESCLEKDGLKADLSIDLFQDSIVDNMDEIKSDDLSNRSTIEDPLMV